MVDSITNLTLQQRAAYEVEQHGIGGLSKTTGENPGTIYRVLHGGNSPTLRRLWNVRKHPRRVRLTIDCTPEMIRRFDSQCGDMTRQDYLTWLLDLSDGVKACLLDLNEGIKELDY